MQEAQRAREEGERRRRERGHDRRYRDRYRDKYRRVCIPDPRLSLLVVFLFVGCINFHSVPLARYLWKEWHLLNLAFKFAFTGMLDSACLPCFLVYYSSDELGNLLKLVNVVLPRKKITFLHRIESIQEIG